MILVVCPNLAVDRTLEVTRLDIGQVHRAKRVEVRAGGKGVNTARALAALGEDVLLLGLAGGPSGVRIASGLREEGIEAELVPMSSDSRTCTIVLEPEGVATVINEAGPAWHDTTSLRSRFHDVLGRARAVAFMGSLLPGSSEHAYADMVEDCRAAKIPSLVDTSESALPPALAARPTIAKPNQGEAEALLECRLESMDDIVAAAARLLALGPELAVITLGSRGVVASSRESTARAHASVPPKLTMGNPTGAGDALAAGLLAGLVRGYPFEDTIRLGVAAATASLARGYGQFRSKDVRVEAVRFELL